MTSLQPRPSPLQTLIHAYTTNSPTTTTTTTTPRTSSSNTSRPPSLSQADSLLALALQIQHNLQHQHAWTALTLHTHSPLTHAPLPRPLLSGLPPKRLYIHPEEQVELLKEAAARKKKRKEAREKKAVEGSQREEEKEEVGLQVDVQPEREWVLPTRLGERWTLRRLAEVFDGVGVVPPDAGEEGVDEMEEDRRAEEKADGASKMVVKGDKTPNPWRMGKRLVLASVGTDSTVVYYIVHDGVVKPRQN